MRRSITLFGAVVTNAHFSASKLVSIVRIFVISSSFLAICLFPNRHRIACPFSAEVTPLAPNGLLLQFFDTSTLRFQSIRLVVSTSIGPDGLTQTIVTASDGNTFESNELCARLAKLLSRSLSLPLSLGFIINQ
jgi:hypothetical protein